MDLSAKDNFLLSSIFVNTEKAENYNNILTLRSFIAEKAFARISTFIHNALPRASMQA